ncbi:1,4-alpha-glucan branching enzyme (Glycogen branching enzyme) [Oceaniovalibus guishaninsula JLT2003]|uniref:1,4-alpha-glucan branching enzyme GlgB n=1 Tax=Oceaniovalibus guishaninsula JLT2003 TaxID=1231392 RepID=K2H6R8_9RHOB|nr:1,4-alpha-glucan branching protein GlgB [Oceaniovalibus guishaninsula]EKE43358.1 1,4-alpha-glucan branching enzyme (Glycogen branching enzyme) [Oceaniovalibus guishaninsula JLT2003]
MTETIAPDAPTMEAIVRGQHGDPFAVLGPSQRDAKAPVVNVFAPDAGQVWVIDGKGKVLGELDRVHPEGFFSGRIKGKLGDYRLRMKAGEHEWERDDPYRFGPFLGEMDEYLLAEGRHEELWNKLGAHPVTHEGMEGTAFAVWAPNARRVSVVGHFNAWDGRRNPMRRRGASGVWELFIPGLTRGEIYKYEILGAYGHIQPLKTDPLSFKSEVSPETASVIEGPIRFDWTDEGWVQHRDQGDAREKPVSIYEMHLGSWRRGGDGEILDYATQADLLVDYVTEMGFTHVEFLPVSEHPFSGSWGYQPIGLFAPTSRFGTPEQFAALVNTLHGAGIGVIVDWVPAHFPSDAHGLARFDGTALYEHEDPRLGFHKDWNTLIYNFGRREVANFLRSSAVYWLKEFHVDALRVDAVASMLYLDYSRNEGEWIPNRYGGRENLDAIDFLRGTNALVRQAAPGALTIAEESTAFPGVSRPVEQDGLGFDFKWNMGWMHDTLSYMAEDPINRKYHHDKMTFGLHYAFSENFVLPLSHDEVVHGKGSMLGKMPGDRWQKFANLRAYYGWMWGHPGKKLLFMGGEFGQEREWNHDISLDWHLLDDPAHEGLRKLVRDLNALYARERGLHERDCSPDGFQWINGGDADNNVFSFVRRGADGADPVVVICNFAPVLREGFRLGMPAAGRWTEALNTDASEYGGSGAGNGGVVVAVDDPMHGQPASATITLPPLGTLFLRPEG